MTEEGYLTVPHNPGNWTILAFVSSSCKLRLLVCHSLPLCPRSTFIIRALEALGPHTAYVRQAGSSSGETALRPIGGGRRQPQARSLLDRAWYTIMTSATSVTGQNGLHLVNRLEESRSPYVSPR